MAGKRRATPNLQRAAIQAAGAPTVSGLSRPARIAVTTNAAIRNRWGHAGRKRRVEAGQQVAISSQQGSHNHVGLVVESKETIF